MKPNNNECKGCLIEGLCGYKHAAKIKKCPCVICLIKGVCRSPCEGYTQFMVIVNKEIDEGNDEQWKTIAAKVVTYS